ncbi:TPA: recombinase family protein [Vibrio harveyi]|nr:recombinase family protein [Vibrio harveyi]
MTQYIYARTSTTDQNVEQQVNHLIEKSGWTNAQVFSEQLSGKSLDREQLSALREVVTEGDAILVLSISRVGRNTLEVIEFVEEMRTKKVSVHVLDMGLMDITSSTGKFVMTALAAVAEMQREEMLEKQAIGIARAKAEGKYKGKQQSQETIKACEAAIKDMEQGWSQTKAAKANGISRMTLYRYINEVNQKELGSE